MANLSNINNKFLVTTGGDVGIGVTGPVTKLNVAGNIAVTATKAYRMYNAANNGWGEMSFIEADNRIQFNRGIQNSGADWRLSENSASSYVCALQGNFGIGTSSPDKKLEVAGDLQLDASNANMWIKSGTTGTNGFINWTFNSDSTVYIKTGIDYDTRASLGYHIDSGYPITIDCTTYIDFKRSAGVLGRWNSTGLGIGTTSPAAGSQLTLRSSASTGITILSASNTGECFINFSDNDDANVGQIFYGHSPDRMAFRVGDDTRVTILGSNGNVGIGTTSPSGLLHLKGDTNSNGAEIYLQVNNNNTTDNLGAIHFGNNIDSTLSEILSQTSGANNSSSLIFSTSSTGTKAERMRIKSDGNILVADTRRIQFYNTDQYIGATSTNDLEIQAGDDINYRSNFSRFFSGTTEHCRVSGLSNQNNWIANGTGGKLGIGTTSPTAKLHVASSANADVIFKLENTNTGTSAGAKIELIDDEGGSGSGAGALRHSISSMSQTVGNWIIESGSAAGRLQFSTLDSFAMIINENQNVGIGTTSPAAALDIKHASVPLITRSTNNNAIAMFNEISGGYSHLYLYQINAGARVAISTNGNSYFNGGSVGIGTTPETGTLLHLEKNSAANTVTELLRLDCGENSHAAGKGGKIVFRDINVYNDTATIEAVRLSASSGSTLNFRLRNSANGPILALRSDHIAQFQGTSTSDIIKINSGTGLNANVGMIIFQDNSNNYLGQITANSATTTTSYLSASDYRLKEDLKDFNGLDLVSNIKVYDFKWKAADERTYGVIAHELNEVIPQAVDGEKDAERMQSADYSKIVPVLVKAIQELKAEIEILKNK